MSRGPGRMQRAILDELVEHEALVVTHPEQTTAEQVALRRAAYTLEKAGKVKLTSVRVAGRPRLVACRPDANFRPPLIVTGLDGKEYRQPGLRTVPKS